MAREVSLEKLVSAHVNDEDAVSRADGGAGGHWLEQDFAAPAANART